jgi:hypothetical protein
MHKDGLVISKDILSVHVYKHKVEESAAYSSHVMYFRHQTHPNPRDFSLPAPIGDMSFKDVDGIAMPFLIPYSGMLRLVMRFALISGASYLALNTLSKIYNAVCAKPAPMQPEISPEESTLKPQL